MKLLLDTHVLVWWDSDPSRLSVTALTALVDPTNEIMLSVASAWEIVIKSALGKLELRLPLEEILRQQQLNGLTLLPISLDHVLAVEHLPSLHKDPFDRVLIAQATVESATLISADPLFS